MTPGHSPSVTGGGNEAFAEQDSLPSIAQGARGRARMKSQFSFTYSHALWFLKTNLLYFCWDYEYNMIFLSLFIKDQGEYTVSETKGLCRYYT